MSTEKKTINYNSMELPCIESGYWPDGVTLVMCDVEGQDVRYSEIEQIEAAIAQRARSLQPNN